MASDKNVAVQNSQIKLPYTRYNLFQQQVGDFYRDNKPPICYTPTQKYQLTQKNLNLGPAFQTVDHEGTWLLTDGNLEALALVENGEMKTTTTPSQLEKLFPEYRQNTTTKSRK
jgi:hypothetical protein